MPENPYQPPKEANEVEGEEITWRYIAEYVLWTVVGAAVFFGLCYAALALIAN